ncbi:MAG TPA: chitobiase/beta-hexosaminidase C-terminal domain-containing protein, partial [Acidobacteriaceae bacterium]|nr:chitobiase/beta-hexosaminidase C-terminal domain-containing protein [Acidobacteriaceae bacterium]
MVSVLAVGALTGCVSGSFSGVTGINAEPIVVAPPTFSPAAGTYTTAEAVTISDITPGATVYYTTDGTIPTTSSDVYSVPFSVGRNETIRAMAVKSSIIDSDVTVATYTIDSGSGKVETCSTGVLPAGDADTDLEVNGNTCVVDGTAANGTYIYRNVNIWGGGKLNFADAKIDFHAHSILVENGGTLQAGASAPVVGPITIWLYGDADDGIAPIACKSSPTCGVPPDIWTSNTSMATKTTPAGPCTPASTYGTSPVGNDCFYQYDVLDPNGPAGAYFSRKSLALSYGGTIYLRGAKGIRGGAIDATPSDSGTSW